MLLLALPHAGVVAEDPPQRLSKPPLHEEALHCEPRWRFFCSNIHIGCSGRTRVRAPRFQISIRGDVGGIRTGSANDALARRYSGAMVIRAEAPEEVLLRPRLGAGYLRLSAGGRYVLRYYRDGIGLMSQGRCHRSGVP